MVRALFLVAPFKRHMIESMIEHFSARVVSECFTPGIEAARTPRGKLVYELAGDRTLRRVVHGFEPDIVYSDNALYAAHFKLYAETSGLRIPLIIHLRGDWWREFSAWWPTAKWPGHLLGMQQYVYQSLALLRASRVTPICRWLERVVKHHIPWKRTTVIYQGVDPKQFYEEPGFEFKRPAVAIIQNHLIYPKVSGLLRLASVVEKLPDINFYITEGEEFDAGYLSLVKQRYSALENTHFMSGINGPIAVRKMLSSVDCYVLASELDCSPTTVLEASLMKRPVIASRVGGVPEIVLENETGWTIPNGSIDDWMRKISIVTRDEKLGRRMGSKGCEWVSENFNWTKIAGQVERLLIDESA